MEDEDEAKGESRDAPVDQQLDADDLELDDLSELSDCSDLFHVEVEDDLGYVTTEDQDLKYIETCMTDSDKVVDQVNEAVADIKAAIKLQPNDKKLRDEFKLASDAKKAYGAK